MIITNKELLQRKSSEAELSEVNDIVANLEAELAKSAAMGAAGVGLSHIQICDEQDSPKRVAIVRIDKSSINLVNTVIEKTFDKSATIEGCLSLPGKECEVDRYQEIVVRNGVEPYHFVATGLFAVCIQHEMDHWDGVLISDKQKPVEQNNLSKTNNDTYPRNLPCPCGSGKKYAKCCKGAKNGKK